LYKKIRKIRIFCDENFLRIETPSRKIEDANLFLLTILTLD
jgi:hypothetical protein